VSHPTALSPITRLAGADLDVLVIGAGITGACIALDAVRRGLRTALVDRGDYGAGATANCLRIVHGGLRYLQHLDVRRSRESIHERSVWLRSAPHLVEPLPVVVPTMRGAFPPRWLLAGALAVNEALSMDRNAGIEPGRQIPRSRLLARDECLSLVPALDHAEVSGGVLFHDAIMYSPERLTLEVVQAARLAGALTANYVAFESARLDGGRVSGAVVRDALSGETAELRTKWIVNAAGARVNAVAGRMTGAAEEAELPYSIALNLVTRRALTGPAFTIRGAKGDPDRVVRSGARQLFVVPWRGQELVGTAHFPFLGKSTDAVLPDEYVNRFFEEIHNASPSIGLTRDDVRLVQWGLLPMATSRGDDVVRLLKHHRIIQHRVAGALSVVSVKFTTARRLAEEVVDRLTAQRLSRGEAPLSLALPGKLSVDVDAAVRHACRQYAGMLPQDVIEHLVRAYGSRYEQVAALSQSVEGGSRRLAPDAPVIAAQLVHGAREENARTPEDLLWRRTELGARGLITTDAVQAAEEALRLAS
jgi:glycerol-3-phosphate dehydrogenase